MMKFSEKGGLEMKISRIGYRVLRVVAVILLLILASVAGGQAAEWKPSKPIQFVVPYAPGGGSDVLARSIENIIKSEKLCPVPIIVVNQAGGSGTIGMTSVAQSPGNAHMLMTFISGQVTAPLVAGKGVATFHDLTLICNLALDEQLIVVKTDSPFKTIEEIVAAAKQKPGAITIGGTATGQEDQLCNRLFERAAGIKLRYVPFNSGGECITALLGGHVEMIWANPSEFVPQWEAKMVRPVVVAKEMRIPLLPDIPTFKEKGYDVTFKFFRGIAAPPGIPAEAAAFYENMMKRMSESSGWKEKYLKQYMLSPGWMGSKDFTQFVNQSEQLFKDILKDLGLLK
jgi:putative tricarboxylic transport membrane protein